MLALLDFVVIVEYDILVVVYVRLMNLIHHRNIDFEYEIVLVKVQERVVREIDV